MKYGGNLFRGIARAAMLFLTMLCHPAFADDLVWHYAITTLDAPKYQKDFPHFDYVNVNAPKGGSLVISPNGPSTFNTLNPALDKGDIGSGLAYVFETLMAPSQDEPSTYYGLLAEAVAYPADMSYEKVRLNAAAKWADGQPVTADDVVFSFNKQKELDPQFSQNYTHVVKVEKTADREVTFTFDEKGNRDILFAIAQLTVMPKHWWDGKDASGKPRDISETSLEVPMGSGPYEITSVTPGSKIVYKLRNDYWGKALNVNVGRYNFGTLEYDYYADRNAEFEAFRKGNFDYWWEESSQRWATGYDFPAVNDGSILREKLINSSRASGVMTALIPNMRRDIFKDQRVREALSYAFDFEDLNRTIFYNAYERINSYFFGTELASSGLPSGRELEILNGIKDLVPASVFSEVYKNPVGGNAEAMRNNLKTAIGLLKAAGYELRGNKMINKKTGQPLTFEILLVQQNLDRVVLPFTRNLAKIGITATVRLVDVSQYINRLRSRDYDMIYSQWKQSLSPGNEQQAFWGSKSADVNGSYNYAGIADPGIDKLINDIIFAKDREDLVASTHALDRVLLAHHYVIPTYDLRADRIAFWNTITHAKELPYYSTGFPSVWWSTKVGAK